MQLQTISIHIAGKVQGVWFRKYAAVTAKELGISGTVANLPDGAVHIVATGTTTQLEALINWCKKGSPLAIVTDVTITALPLELFDGFQIHR